MPGEKQKLYLNWINAVYLALLQFKLQCSSKSVRKFKIKKNNGDVSISLATHKANFAEVIQLFFLLFNLIACCLQLIIRKVGQM